MMKMVSQLSKPEPKPQLPEPKETPLDIVRRHLDAKGEEILQAALEQYPEETKAIVEKLTEIIKAGKITETIDAGDLYTLFRNIGLRVKIDTKILYVKRGEAKDLRELLKK